MTLELLLDDNEVISDINQEISEEMDLSSTVKVSELIEEIISHEFSENFLQLILNKFECKALRYRSENWQTGKLKLCIIFVPDIEHRSESISESSNISPLDSLRIGCPSQR